MLTEQLKANIANGMRAYLATHQDTGMSQNKLAKLCGVNAPYVGYVLDNKWNAVPAQGGTALGKISDAVFLKIQKALGLRQEVFETVNFLAMEDRLREAKIGQQWCLVDGLTGTGKSFAAEAFARQNPKETFLVQAANNMNQKEFLQAVARAVGANEQGTPYRIGGAIAERLLGMEEPLLIVDEAEGLFKRNSEGGFRGLKDLHNLVKERCGVVLIGANKFREALVRRANNLTGCFPQLYSRLEKNGLEMAPLSREDVALIAPAYGVRGKRELDRLFDTTANFRALFDTLRHEEAEAQLLTAAA